ncbi:hypothetical protein [Chitinophaga caseinilytica]|uniref:Transposase IS200-like domain-containing protein n=1 Tax=Chitinophaga caseinilytica TaxID=2267521 RepID=A0ABZ2Z4Z6_9BACT
MSNFYPIKQPGCVQLMTACCYKDHALLRDDRYKQFVMEGLTFMVAQQRIWLYGYVLLEDEFHAMWQQRPPWEKANVRQPLLRHIARRIKYDLRATDPGALELYRSHLADRVFQFWEKQKIRVEITSFSAAGEMLENMHQAPVNSGLCGDQIEYPYSSAWFYGDRVPPADIPVPELTDFSNAFQHPESMNVKPESGRIRKRFIRSKGGLLLPKPPRSKFSGPDAD